jgi:colanic acid biosynthesis glycosyl transferase WcaI
MRIIFINQFYWPDGAATSQYLTDLTRFLAEQGHEVEVLCGDSSYARLDGMEDEPPTVVHRISCSRFSSGLLARLCSYLSFFFGALWVGLHIMPADVVVTMTTPPMLSVIGAFIKKVRGVKHFIWEMDLFPEALVDVGLVKRNSWVVGLLGRIADWSRLNSDGVIVLGDCMRRRLVERGIPESQIHVAENWADGSQIFPLPIHDRGPLKILYSGNLGRPHDIETIMYAMEQLKGEQKFHFQFVGDGVRRKEISDFCSKNGIVNTSFAPYCRRDEMSGNLASGDIGLVTQRDACLGTVVPSKIYALLAAGRPILYIGPRESTPADIIRRFGCGWQIDCGNGEAVLELLRDLEANRDKIAAAGMRARSAFLGRYDLPQGVARVCTIIAEPVSAPASYAATISG